MLATSMVEKSESLGRTGFGKSIIRKGAGLYYMLNPNKAKLNT